MLSFYINDEASVTDPIYKFELSSAEDFSSAKDFVDFCKKDFKVELKKLMVSKIHKTKPLDFEETISESPDTIQSRRHSCF